MTTRPKPELELAPARVAELRNLAMRLNTIIANVEQQAAAYRAIGANIRHTLAGLGYPSTDPVFDRDVRMVQGLDDVRGQVEAEVTALATLTREVGELRGQGVCTAGDVRRLAADVAELRAEIAGLQGISTDLAAAMATMARIWGGGPLVSESFVIQSNEVLRDLRRDIQRAPDLTSHAVAVAVGATLRPLLTEILGGLLDERAEALEGGLRVTTPPPAGEEGQLDRAA